jgi:hypothetical protein
LYKKINLEKKGGGIAEKYTFDLLILFTIAFLYFKLFFFFEHLPQHDEIHNIDRYLLWKNFLRKDVPNHTLLNFFGTIIHSFIGFKFEALRLISFFSFIGILLIFRKLFKSKFLLLIFLLTLTNSDVLFNNIYLYRGYTLNAFITIIIFISLFNYFRSKKIKYLNLSFFFLSLLFVHSLYSLYLGLAIVIYLCIKIIKNQEFEKIKKFIVFFLFPCSSILLLSFIVTGFAEKFPNNLNLNFIFNNLYDVIKSSIMPGFKSAMFPEALNNTRLDALKLVKNATITMLNGEDSMFGKQWGLLIIFFATIITLFISFYRNKINDFDYIIILFFIIFFAIGKVPPVRVHVAHVYFLVFYIIMKLSEYQLVRNFELKSNKKTSFMIILAIIFTLFNAEPNTKYNLQLNKEIKKINLIKKNCENANIFLTQYEIWILINFYPNDCKYYYDYENKINILYK